MSPPSVSVVMSVYNGSRHLEESIDDLPEREREVVRLYHEKGLTLRAIGSLMNVSESRIAQMHSRALKRIKDRMSHWADS